MTQTRILGPTGEPLPPSSPPPSSVKVPWKNASRRKLEEARQRREAFGSYAMAAFMRGRMIRKAKQKEAEATAAALQAAADKFLKEAQAEDKP